MLLSLSSIHLSLGLPAAGCPPWRLRKALQGCASRDQEQLRVELVIARGATRLVYAAVVARCNYHQTLRESRQCWLCVALRWLWPFWATVATCFVAMRCNDYTPTRRVAAHALSYQRLGIGVVIWNLGTHEFRYDFTIFFIYMNSYMNS